MKIPTQILNAQNLEHHLVDPKSPDVGMSYKRIIELDENEEYPKEFYQLLDEWGFGEFFIPSQLGGKLTSYEETIWFARVLSRRDLTSTVGYFLTYGATVPVWVKGSNDQKSLMV